ncbi:GAF domain-containing protein [Cohnella zeiphila]|uniref:GAF domain-containing protein n=1 Tax=Cohnella zeiphila TaxID=2761120 RepID=A0A7X0VWH6_9BACL|nr:GAF domain-containing protein [Cohnella zeiphila]MBB6732505.1 GAF domain-containing protein [Cohnella zeiphila]
MAFVPTSYTGTPEENERLLFAQLRGLAENETNRVANLANAAALLNGFLPDINWVGFYLLENGELVLGPFQGQPACVRIPLGRGVCGTAAARLETLIVEDVHRFPGHIACDPASRAEIVVPLYAQGRLIGVLDVDSPRQGRFSEEDKQLLEEFNRRLSVYL